MRFYFSWGANPKFLKAFFLLPDFHTFSVIGLQNEVTVISIQTSAYLSRWQVSSWVLYKFGLTVWPSKSKPVSAVTPQTQIRLSCKTNDVAFIVMHLLAAVLLATFNLSLAALANYSVTRTKITVLKYRGVEITHSNLSYLLLFLPYSV